jgi:hypothetical protein
MPSESISEMKMGHLIAVYIQENGVSMWFDTSGEHPYLKTHLDFLRKNSSASYFASKATQSDFVNVCGQYSVSFLLWIYNKTKNKQIKAPNRLRTIFMFEKIYFN